MTTFLLIHGSFVGGWIWQPTVERLRAGGHTAYAPTSDGCAERKGGLRAGLSVAGAARELADLLYYEDLADVVAAATSTGGLILEALAPLARDRIARLVFLDALVPLPGESIKSIVQQRPGQPPYTITEFTRAPSRDMMKNDLFSELAGDVKSWALDRATPHPLGLSDADASELDDFWKGRWTATVVRCTASPNPPESHQRRTAEKLNARYIEIEAGHYPMLTDPETTARVLLDA